MWQRQNVSIKDYNKKGSIFFFINKKGSITWMNVQFSRSKWKKNMKKGSFFFCVPRTACFWWKITITSTYIIIIQWQISKKSIWSAKKKKYLGWQCTPIKRKSERNKYIGYNVFDVITVITVSRILRSVSTLDVIWCGLAKLNRWY